MRPLILTCIAASYTIAGEWEPLGPFGGSAAIVQVDGHHPGTLLAGTSNAQIFQSEDSGESWKALPFPGELRAMLHALAIDQRNPGVYLAGLSSVAPQYSGIMRTLDGGRTWKRIPAPGLSAVWSIAIYPQDSRVIAAGGENGLWLTRDGGDSWERATPWNDSELTPVVAVTFDPWDSKILYAGTPHLAWKTADGGTTWQSIHEGMLDDSDIFSILVDDRRRRRVFAATCGGIYRSLEGGVGWTKLIEAKGASYRTYHIAQDPFQPNVLLAGTSQGLVKSVDSGSTWRTLSAHSTRWITFDPKRPNRIFVATDEAGLLRSDDGGESLQPINQGFSNQSFATLVAVAKDLYVTTLSAGGSLILRRSDSAAEWDVLLNLGPQPMQSETSALPDKLANGLSLHVLDDLWIHDPVTTEGSDLLAASSRGLARSHNAGVTWQLVAGTLAGSTVSALCRHPTRAGVLFASVFGKIFGSRDGGHTWLPLTTGDEQPGDLTALLVLPGDPDRLLALSRSRGVYSMALPAEWQN
jgi:photosystem II stability/assembly factor-like uncharacterized protein